MMLLVLALLVCVAFIWCKIPLELRMDRLIKEADICVPFCWLRVGDMHCSFLTSRYSLTSSFFSTEAGYPFYFSGL